ncbi:MAG: MFS transporter [Clostridia bacterium]|nr:MFS transporter [Clostridia bacterium]
MRLLKKRLHNIIRYNPIRLLYEEARLPDKIRRSLNLILLGNIFGTIWGIICGGGTTAMIGLATELGAGDIHFGILSAIPQVAALLQIPFSVLVNRTHKRKRYMLTLGLFSRFLWLLFGLIPIIFPMSSQLTLLYMLIFLLGVSSCMGAVINVCWFPWLSDLAPIRMRGRWMSIRESFLAAANVSCGLLTALLLDTLPVETRYIIIFLIGGAAGMIDMICFGFCEEVYSAPPQKQSMVRAVKEVFSNKPFMSLVILWTAWSFTANMSGVYLTPYSMNEMGLTFLQIMLFSTIAAGIVSMFVMPKWGKMIDRFGCRNVMCVACAGASLTPLFYLLSSPGNVWPTLLHNTIGAMFWCGSNLTASNMQLSCSPDHSRPMHIAVFSCVTAMLGATLGSLAGGALLEAWHSANLFTGSFDRYQALILLSVVLRLALALLLTPRLARDSEHTVRDMLAYIAQAPRRMRFRRLLRF